MSAEDPCEAAKMPQRETFSAPVRPGDWIRFYQNGRLVIGRLEYITADDFNGADYCTDIGVTRSFEEARRG